MEAKTITLAKGVELQAVKDEDGKPFAVLKPLCDTLGINYRAAEEKLKRQRWSTVRKIRTVGFDGKKREMTCIDDRTMLMWFASIDADTCHPEVRVPLGIYQDEAADALLAWGSGTRGGAIGKYDELMMSVIDTQKQLSGLIAAIAPVIADANRKQDAILEITQRIEDQTKGKRHDICADNKRLYRSCCERFYQGMCPCCQKNRVLIGNKPTEGTQYDHYHHRSMNQLEHCWIVCRKCNSDLRDRKANGYWFQSGPAFQQFQRLLSDDRQQRLFN